MASWLICRFAAALAGLALAVGVAAADDLADFNAAVENAARHNRVALGYLQEAWAEARHDGIDGDCLAQACLFTALAEFVTTYGEEAAAKFTDGLSARIRNGEFSIEQRQ